MSKTFNVGDIVEYSIFGDGTNLRLALVTSIRKNIKNGKPGFDGYEPTPSDSKINDQFGYWGYSEDVTRVWRKS